MEAKNLGKGGDKRKVTILLTFAGADAREYCASFNFAEGEEGRYTAVVGKFEEHCKEDENEMIERYKSRCQRNSKSFDQLLVM